MAKEKNKLERVCISCRKKYPRHELVRVLKPGAYFSDKTVLLNPNKSVFGRSAYICRKPSCIHAAVKGKKVEKMLRLSHHAIEHILSSLDKEAA